jgi:hypothetical protein
MSVPLTNDTPTPPVSPETTLAVPKGKRLGQLLDVSRAEPQDGDSLVWDTNDGVWEPRNVTPGTGDIITDMLADSAVTDGKIGERTVSDTTSPTSNTGLLTVLLTGLATMVKNITGKANWRTAPAITLEALNLHKARHATGGADALSPADIGASSTTHTHADASTTVSGFMAPSAVTKLNGIATDAAAVSSSTPTAEAVGSTGASGSSTTASRSDHRHAMPGLATGGVDGFMAAADKSKLDGIAAGAVPTAGTTPAAEAVGSTSSVGAALYSARADHRHAMPGLVTTSTDGFMDSSDKSKLDGIAAGANVGPTLSSGTPDSLTANQSGYSGSSSQASRADHQHPTTAFVPQIENFVDTITSDYTVPATTFGTVTSFNVTPSASGTYLVIASIDWRNINYVGSFFEAKIVHNSLDWGLTSFTANTSGDRATTILMSIVTFTLGSNIHVQARKSGGTGTSVIENYGTKLIAIRLA